MGFLGDDAPVLRQLHWSPVYDYDPLTASALQ